MLSVNKAVDQWNFCSRNWLSNEDTEMTLVVSKSSKQYGANRAIVDVEAVKYGENVDLECWSKMWIEGSRCSEIRESRVFSSSAEAGERCDRELDCQAESECAEWTAPAVLRPGLI